MILKVLLLVRCDYVIRDGKALTVLLMDTLIRIGRNVSVGVGSFRKEPFVGLAFDRQKALTSEI